MFGTFRVILALLVLLSHISIGSFANFNYGCWAVVCFFMISGYVMTLLIRSQYGRLGRSTFYFYADRFLRIYPQYFLFIVIIQIADLILYLDIPLLKTEPTWWKFFLNALIVPVNYFMFIPSITQYQLISPAWSLGLEEQFYWIFPLLLLIPWFGRSITLASFLIFIFGIFGILDTELFIVRLLPGVIFIFMMGKYLAEYNSTKSNESFWTATVLYTGTLILTVSLWLFKAALLTKPYTKEVLLGILIGFPIIVFLSRTPRKKWDEFLGHSSYGIFLGHFFVFAMLIHFRLFEDNYACLVIVGSLCSIVTGFLGYYIAEKPTLRFRHALRKRHAQVASSD